MKNLENKLWGGINIPQFRKYCEVSTPTVDSSQSFPRGGAVVVGIGHG